MFTKVSSRNRNVRYLVLAPFPSLSRAPPLTLCTHTHTGNMATPSGSPEWWTNEDDRLLAMMYAVGWSSEAMAGELARSVDEVNKRLRDPDAALDSDY